PRNVWAWRASRRPVHAGQALKTPDLETTVGLVFVNYRWGSTDARPGDLLPSSAGQLQCRSAGCGGGGADGFWALNRTARPLRRGLRSSVVHAPAWRILRRDRERARHGGSRRGATPGPGDGVGLPDLVVRDAGDVEGVV